MGPTIFEASKNPHKKVIHHQKDPNQYSAVLRSAHPSKNPFVAYSPKPEHFHFESQDENEKVLLLLRMHPITQLPWILVVIAMFLAPTVVLPYVPILALLPAIYQVVILMGWYLLTTAITFEKILTWIFNVYIITDERIIDTDFYSLIYKRISEAKLDRIEDVTSETGGMLRSLFDFGTVTVQTAAERREFEFEDIPHPGRVIKLLNELMLEEEQEAIEGRVR